MACVAWVADDDSLASGRSWTCSRWHRRMELPGSIQPRTVHHSMMVLVRMHPGAGHPGNKAREPRAPEPAYVEATVLQHRARLQVWCQG